MNEIKEKITHFVREHSLNSGDKIYEDTLIFREGYLDSMGFISLIGFLEEEFNLLPNDEDLTEQNFESIRAISRFVEAH